MKKSYFYFAAFLVLIVTCLLGESAFAQSCPMCKESMTAAGAKLSEGFYLSIMSMFFLPFAIGGAIGSLVFKSWWTRTHPGSELPLHLAMATAWRERKR
ncbi:MAG: hypothetical protein ABI444_08830 [Candidatus Kapaibacterium sp.]